MPDSPTSKGTRAERATPEIAGWMAGEYRLGRKLGEGGFGAVYEAVHPLLKRRAAVKVLHRIAGSDSDAVLRFVAEARAVNQIRNRHIIDIFSFGKLPDGRHFYVMDLLEGEPLDRFLAREGRCSVAATVQLLRPIAEALDAAHLAGVVHRDLKPQNIYLSWNESGETVPKLLDFGMAKLLGDSPVHTQSGTPLGTPLYMSPEQAKGDPVDGRSDVYALGVLCHELLTGRLPIGGENTIAVLMAHIISAPPSVSEVSPDLPSELDAPVLRMLEKKPELRQATAGEALAELARAAESAGLAIFDGPPSLPRPALAAESERAHSRETADTTLQPFSPASFSDAERGRGAMVRTAAVPTLKSFPRWPLWAALVLLGAGATLWLSRGWHTLPQPTPSAVAAPVPAPASAAQATLPAASSSASAALDVSALPAPKPKKHAPGVGSAHPLIPKDLENPF